MGGAGSSSRLATHFGDKETQGRRGPTLGGALVSGPEGWRLVLVAPVCIKIFDAHTKDAKAIPIEDAAAEAALKGHVPFTACSTNDDEAEPSLLAVGCQDGTVFVFSLANGTFTGPLHELRASGGDEASPSDAVPAEDAAETPALRSSSLMLSIAVLLLSGRQSLYAGVSGRCLYWDLGTGELQREFQLPAVASGSPIPSTLAAVGGGQGDEGLSGRTHLWVGMDHGSIAVFDVSSGVLVRSFSCNGPEALVSLAHFPENNAVFALSAHRRVSVWDASTYACMHTYAAELMTCGADLSAMIAVSMKDPDLSLLMLAGVDSSLCVRRVSRRPDGKLNCVLLYFLENVGGDGAPITALNYHAASDSVLAGDAGCAVAVICNLKEQLGTAVQAQNEVISARAAAAAPAVNTAAEQPGHAEEPAVVAAEADGPVAPSAAPPELGDHGHAAGPPSQDTASAGDHDQAAGPPLQDTTDAGVEGELPAGAPMFLGS